MPFTFSLLQIAGLLLAAVSGYLFLREPFLWSGQALILSLVAGLLTACLLLSLLGFGLLREARARWGHFALHLAPALLMLAVQLYLGFQVARLSGFDPAALRQTLFRGPDPSTSLPAAALPAAALPAAAPEIP